MARREKIILTVMAVVVVFGLYDFLFSSKPKPKPSLTVSGVAETGKFVADVANSLRNDAAQTDMYMLQQARNAWRRDPFWHKIQPPESEAEAKVESRKEPKSEESRDYTGYLEMGAQKLAIINGAEYEPGDELGMGGPVVKSISPDEVILMVPGTADKIILPLTETR